MSTPAVPPRRHFLKVLAGTAGALIVGVPLFDARAADAPVPLRMLGDDLRTLGTFVRVDSQGDVLIGARDPDTGTGVTTSLARIIADEMDADWNRVSVVALGLGVENRDGKPARIYGHQTGGLGTSIPAAWNDLRQAGALARWLLCQTAARRLGVPADRLRCLAGTVIAPDGRRLEYGDLAAAAARIALPAQPPALKTPDRYTLIGQGVGDVDALAMVTGQNLFAIDHDEANALVAILARCPWPDGRLAHLDSSAALKVKGVVKVLTLKPDPRRAPGETVRAPAVAVLASDTWSALQGRDALKLEWRPGAGADESSAELEKAAGELLDAKGQSGQVVRNDGDVDAVAKKAAHRLEATYVQPWLAHATPEPMNCLARVDRESAVLVVPTQAPQRAWAVVAQLTGLRPEQIQIKVPRVGGGYGRRLDHDFVAEAVLLAKAAERPVRVLWTREDDFTGDWYQPASTQRLTATLDKKRNLTTWTHRVAGPSAAVGRGVPTDRLWTAALGAAPLPAGLVPNYRCSWYAQDAHLPRGPYRAMPETSNAFAAECFLDEIADLLKEDPLVTRLRVLGEPRMVPLGGGGVFDVGRLRNVLQQVADRIGWKNWLHSVNGLGLACWHVNGAYVAHAIEVMMQGDKLTIARTVCAVDVGRVINPTGLAGQIAGATLDALSQALNLAVTVRNGQVQQKNFKDYPLAGMAQLPREVETIILPADERTPTGASFLAMPTAAPALANAVFRATQVRVRRLPLMKELLRRL